MDLDLIKIFGKGLELPNLWIYLRSSRWWIIDMSILDASRQFEYSKSFDIANEISQKFPVMQAWFNIQNRQIKS